MKVLSLFAILFYSLLHGQLSAADSLTPSTTEDQIADNVIGLWKDVDTRVNELETGMGEALTFYLDHLYEE